MRSGRATAECHTGGITEEQLFATMDCYLQAWVGNSAKEPKAAGTDFHQPAPPTPQVITLVRGVINNVGAQGWQRGPGGQGIPSHQVTCFGCGRRGHYANTCIYPPLSPEEQEQLRENACIHCLQQAGLAPLDRGQVIFAGNANLENTSLNTIINTHGATGENTNDLKPPYRAETPMETYPQITEIRE